MVAEPTTGCVSRHIAIAQQLGDFPATNNDGNQAVV
jgi:hypothetical protein